MTVLIFIKLLLILLGLLSLGWAIRKVFAVYRHGLAKDLIMYCTLVLMIWITVMTVAVIL